jgi:hypothetical protein
MTVPSFLFALLIALGLGAVYHLVRGGDWSHLLAYLFMSTLGFAVGHFIGEWRGWEFYKVGAFNVGMGIVGAALFLALADWLIHLPPRAAEE